MAAAQEAAPGRMALLEQMLKAEVVAAALEGERLVRPEELAPLEDQVLFISLGDI